MPDFITFSVWTILILLCFPAIVEIYIEKKGIVSLVILYIHKSDANHIQMMARDDDTLPTDKGQVFLMPRFKRAIHSVYDTPLASQLTPITIRTRIYGTGAIECYDGEKSLGVTHVVSLERKRLKDIELVNFGKYGNKTHSVKDTLICALVWYAALPTLIFGNPRKVGYRTKQ